mmetsp:Transcript_7175/g.17147  ORF Transcript_7175/g.17147 Transcript_7175/m.17147 type:complete len:205 (-) Transcript_7175:438-1052(-)
MPARLAPARGNGSITSGTAQFVRLPKIGRRDHRGRVDGARGLGRVLPRATVGVHLTIRFPLLLQRHQIIQRRRICRRVAHCRASFDDNCWPGRSKGIRGLVCAIAASTIHSCLRSLYGSILFARSERINVRVKVGEIGKGITESVGGELTTLLLNGDHIRGGCRSRVLVLIHLTLSILRLRPLILPPPLLLLHSGEKVAIGDRD